MLNKSNRKPPSRCHPSSYATHKVILILKQVQHDENDWHSRSEKSKRVWYFAHLFVPLAVAESTLVDFVFLLLTRHKMQASSALVSFVGSEILKQVWYFARLFVPLSA